MPRWARRVALVVISLILGFVVTRFLIIPILGTTAPEYAWGPELIPIPYGFRPRSAWLSCSG